MAFEDTVGGPPVDPMAALQSLSSQYAQNLTPSENATLDPIALEQRLARKLLNQQQQRELQSRHDATKAEQQNDLSQFGTPAGPIEDLTQYGTPASEVTKERDPNEWGGYAPVIGKEAARGAVGGAGATLKGAQIGLDIVDKAGRQAPQMAAGGLPGFDAPFPEPDRTPTTQKPLYKAGQAVEEWGEKTFPTTRAERESITGQVAHGVGGFAGMVPGMVAGGVVGGPVGATVAGAAQMAAGGAASTFDDAIAHGADEATAAKAAGLNGLASGALGVIPLGAVLAPLKKVAPGLMGWAATALEQRLARAGAAGVAFATIGEAQEYLAKQIANEFYDSKAKYDFDPKRAVASLLTGAIVGGLAPHGGESAESGPARLPGPEPEAPAGAAPRPGLGGPRGPEPPPGGPGAAPGETARPAGEPPVGQAKMEDILRYYGFSDQEIRGMSPQELRDAVREATTGGGFRPSTPEENLATDLAGLKPDEVSDLLRKFGFSDQDLADIGQDTRRSTLAQYIKSYGDPRELGWEPPRADKGGTTGLGDMGGAGADVIKGMYDRLWRQVQAGETKDLGQENALLQAAKLVRDSGGLQTREELQKFAQEYARIERDAGFQQAMRDLVTNWSKTGARDEPTTDVKAAEQQVNPTPTPGQAEAENFKHGHLDLPELGLTGKRNVSIETAAGGTRNGPIDEKTGQPQWSATLAATYGRLKRTKGADGQPLDIHVGTATDSPHVYILDQKDPKTGKFDEHKIFARFASPADAVQAYLAGHDELGAARIGGMQTLTPAEFKTWLRTGDHTKPVSDAMRTSDASQSHPAKPEASAPAAEAPPGASAAPATADEAMQNLADMFGEEPTAEHHAEVEEMLSRAGVDPHDARPVDIARAAEIMTTEGWSAPDAYQIAVVRLAVESGALSPGQVRSIYGDDKAAAILGPAGTSTRGLGTETPSPATGGEAATAEEGVPERGEGGKGDEGEVVQAAETAAADQPEKSDGTATGGGEREGTDTGGPTVRPAAGEPTPGGKPAAEPEPKAAGEPEHAAPVSEPAKPDGEPGVAEPTGAAEAVAEPESTTKPEPPKRGLDRTQAYAELFTDLSVGESGKPQSVSLLNVESRRAVVTRMGGAIHDRKIREAIVGLVPVDVMDDFIGLKGAPEKVLNDPAVLKAALPVDGRFAIAATRFFDALADGLAQERAEMLLGKLGLRRRKAEGAAANGAGQDQFGWEATPVAGKRAKVGGADATTGEGGAAGGTGEVGHKESIAEKSSRIEDAGEKIGGARKDQWIGRGLDKSDLEKMSGAEQAKHVTKANVWARPDYVTAVETGGVDPQAAFLIKRIYDRLANEPQGLGRGHDLITRDHYITALQAIRDALKDAKTVENVKNARTVIDRVLSQDGDSWSRMRTVTPGRARRTPTYIGWEDTRAAERAVKEHGFPNVEPWQRLFSVVTRSKWDQAARTVVGDEYVVYRKNGGLIGTFDDKDAAIAAAKAAYEKSGKGKGEGEEPKRPHLDRVDRSGPAYRGEDGKNVDSTDYPKDFGFRGVEFGNWVAGDERQKVVNLGYDAMHDLARTLSLPAKAMSLDGTLAVAFGARGRGGKAAAHYEPALRVINMTKLSGAGALAHEWGHALDHYLGELDRENAYGGAPKGLSGWYEQPGKGTYSSGRVNTHLPPRLQNAANRLMEALFYRSENADETLARLQPQIDQHQRGMDSWRKAAAEAKDALRKGEHVRHNQARLRKAEQQIEVWKRYLDRFQEQMEAGKGQLTETDYFKQAKKLSGKTGDYWIRPTEMFARAFEAYVFDKIASEGHTSQYLVQGVEPSRYGSAFRGNPYPVGEERANIGKAFDRLVKALQAGAGKHGEQTKLEGVRGDVEPDPVEQTQPAKGGASETPEQEIQAVEQSTEAATNKNLSDAYSAHLAEQGFANILQARKFAKDRGFSEDPKKVEEELELGVVKRARTIVENGESPEQIFNSLVELYGRQPRLGTRTSTSVRDQAYSTPVPLAYLASRLAGITRETSVYEPTAGNGALLIDADPRKAKVNELNQKRAENLIEQGFTVSSKDASEAVAREKSTDRVIANPPFGVVRDGEHPKVFDLTDIQKNYETTQIDHAIALRALGAMKDDGRAVLILGGIDKLKNTEERRSDAYQGKGKREFYKALYDRYNVTDHFTVSGELYARQGAGWPVDVVVINGRGKSARALPAVDVPRVLNTWDDLGGLVSGQDRSVGAAVGAAAQPGAEGQAPALDGGDRELPGGGGGRVPPTEPGESGAVQPGTPGEPPGRGPGGEVAGGPELQAPGGGERGTPGGSAGAPAAHEPGGLAGFDAAFEDALDAAFGEKPAEKPAERTTAEVAKGAAKHGAKSATEAFEGLFKLFEGDKGTLGGVTGGGPPPFNEETYARAKPNFKRAAEEFAEFRHDMAELVKRLVAHLKNALKMTREAIERMKPYLLRFVQEVRDGTVKLGEEEAPKAEPKPEPQQAPLGSDHQVPYQPKSGGPGMATLVPTNMRRSIAESLDALEKRVGNLDDFVAKELNYSVGGKGNDVTLHEAFGAEQIDAIALAIDNLKAGKGFVIGDQTGIGKGRVNAAIIRWAILNDRVPVFVTEKPNLYMDIYRDLTDTGFRDFLDGREPRFLETNALAQKIDLSDGLGLNELRASKASDKSGLFAELRDPAELKKRYDVVLTNYSQMQTLKGEDTARRQFLTNLAPHAVFLFDESHNAAGELPERQKKGAPQNRAGFARELVGKANGVFYSSATYAKRPASMPFYAATDMVLAVENPKDLADAIERGGVPMQQVVAAMLAEGGQYIRRERDFKGIDFHSQKVPVDLDTYGGIAQSFARINDLSRFIKQLVRDSKSDIGDDIKAGGSALLPDNAIGDESVSSTGFTAVMHNIVGQMLTAMKVKHAVEMGKELIKSDQKPVFTVSGTLETFLSDYAHDVGIAPGEPMTATFNDILLKYLERSRTILVKPPHGRKGETQHVRLTDAQLGPTGVAIYKRAKSLIESLDLRELPVSPIDYLRSEMKKAGYEIGEITGRNTLVDYSGNVPVYRPRPGVETGTRGRMQTIRRTNLHPDNKGLHGLIGNQAMAAGMSIHAGEKFNDKRQRHMITLQAEADINVQMQLFGRINRTGQVTLPVYTQLFADIPAETRPASLLMKKMGSLNANTTAARGGTVLSKDIPDFINQYGDRIAAQFLFDNPDINALLDHPLRVKDDGDYEDEGAMRKLTGRIAMLEPAVQKQVLDELTAEYNAEIKVRNETGENALEAKVMDLKAKRLETTEVVPAKGGSGSPFAAPVVVEKVNSARTSKPHTSEEIATKVLEAAGGQAAKMSPDSARQVLQRFEERGSENPEYRQAQNEAYRKALADFDDYKRPILDEIEDPARAEKERVKLDENKDRWVDLRRSLLPGHRFSINTSSGTFTGIVLHVDHKEGAKNPLALSTWKVTFATAEGQAKTTQYAFSRLWGKDRAPASDANAVEVVPLRWESYAKTLDRFDGQQHEGREERYIATGNLLAAFDWLNRKGKITHFTDENGNIRQGILTARDFELGKHAREKGKLLRDPAEIQKWMDEHRDFEIVSSDTFLRIRRNPRYYESNYLITAERSKSKGGQYYLDKELTGITGDFYSRGGNMTAEVEADRLPQAIKRLQALGAEFKVPAEAPKAKPAEAGMTAPQRRALVPGAEARRADLERELTQIVRHIAGQDVHVVFHDTYPAVSAGWGSEKDLAKTSGGSYVPAEHLVNIAMADPAYSDRAHAAIHESWHGVERVLSERELALFRHEEPRLRQLAAKSLGISPERAADIAGFEIRAEAFWAYMNDRANGGFGAGLHIGLRQVFERLMSMFRRIRNVLAGLGFRTSEDIFAKGAEGELGRRKPQPGGTERFEQEIRAAQEGGGEPPKPPEAGMTAPAGGPRRAEDRAWTAARDRIADLMGSETATWLRERVSDYSERMRLLQNEVEALQRRWIDPDGNLPDRKQFYTLKRLFPGKAANRTDVFTKQHLAPLDKFLRKNGITLDAAGEYLAAKHAEERNRAIGEMYEAGHQFNRAINDINVVGGSGMSTRDARNIVRDYESGPKAAAYAQLRTSIAGIRAFIQSEMVRGSLESQATINAWNAKYHDYVPLRGWEDPAEEPLTADMRSGRRGGIAGPETPRAFGRTSKADNPVANLIQQAFRTIDRAEKNLVLNSLFTALAGLPREAREGLARLNKGAPKRVIDPVTGLVKTMDDWAERFKENAVALKRNGVPNHIYFEDPRIATAVKAWGSYSNEFMRPILWVTNKLKSIWTHYSPDFQARHQARYFVEGLLNSFELKETGNHSAAKYAKEAFPIVGEAARAIWAVEHGRDGGVLGSHYQEMKDQGGWMSMRTMRDIDQIKEHLRITLNSMGKAKINPMRVWRDAAEAINRVTSMWDNAQRLATYHQARLQGMSAQQAALKARDATIDYQHRGIWANVMGIFEPFFNTAIRTGLRMGGAVSRSKTMRRVFLGTVAMGLAASAFNYFIGGNDKDGTPFFDKIPEWDKRLNMILLTPWLTDDKGRPQALKFPMPYNWAFPMTLGYSMGNWMWGKGSPWDAWKMLFRSFLSTFTQVSETSGGGFIGLRSFVPELGRPAYDVATNTNWYGGQVHTEHPQGPASESGKQFTGEGWKDAAKFLNHASGGRQNKSGYLDFYPEDIREIFNPYFETQIRIGREGYETGKSLLQGQAPKPKDVPIGHVFYGTDYDSANRAAARERADKEKRPWLH